MKGYPLRTKNRRPHSCPVWIVNSDGFEYSTIEIRIQGGINAENGFQSIFKVYPVQTITQMPKLRRENRQTGQRQRQQPKNVSFGNVLEEKIGNQCPAECYVVTYNGKSQLQTYYYLQSKEYTF